MTSPSSSISDSARRAAQSARSRLSQGGSGGSASAGSGSRGSGSNSNSSGSNDAGMPAELSGGRTCHSCPDWRYVMGIRRLGGVPYLYSWHHLFLIAWNRGGTGAMPTYSAFPSHPDGDAGVLGPLKGASTSDSSKPVEAGHETDPADSGDMGYLQSAHAADFARSGEYAPDNRYVILRDMNRDLGTELMAQSRAMDAMRIRYVPTGPNSNSFAMSLAERVGLPRRKPEGDAPGSGIKI